MRNQNKIFTSQTQKPKTVSVFGAIALYVASVLGGGILVLPSLTAVAAGAGALIAWIVVSVVSLPIALMFAKLSATIPDAGGVGSFVRKTMGNTAGDIAGWLYLWIIPIGPTNSCWTLLTEKGNYCRVS